MKKFEIVMRRAEISWKNRKSIKEGCTTDGESEMIKSFDTLEEAKKELEKYFNPQVEQWLIKLL